jgi:hypothetical protein
MMKKVPYFFNKTHGWCWCVEFQCMKFHVRDDFRSQQGIVMPCDGSCTNLAEIPADIWEKARLQFDAVKKARIEAIEDELSREFNQRTVTPETETTEKNLLLSAMVTDEVDRFDVSQY